MNKPEWTKIGSGPVEYCVGTDGVTGVSLAGYVITADDNGRPGEYLFDGTEESAKVRFESKHCQPPAPRHIIREYADGSRVVESVEQDEQGRPLRCAIVRTNVWTPTKWGATWSGGFEWFDERQDAIARAARYVETGE